MPKRSAEEKIKHYHEKIKRLESKPEKRKKHRRIKISSDEDEPENERLQDQTNEDSGPMENEIDIGNDIHIDNVAPSGTRDIVTDSTQSPVVNPEPSSSRDLDLDPELLLALGESTSDSPDYGEKILENQAKLWLPLLKKGMPKEQKDKLLKEYIIPDNCRLLQAPKLNAEMAAAIPDTVKNRDKNILCAQQQQLGSGITVINRVMDLILLGGDKIQAIKHLSNGCRLLTDLHCLFTQCRTKLITPSLDKTCLNVIHDAERDETLFGAKISEKIKAAKAIEKQGLQIKKVPPRKTTAGTHRYPYQGNWQAPPRYPPTRGGAGREPSPGARGESAPPVYFQLEELSSEQAPCNNTALVQRSQSSTSEPYPGCSEALRQVFIQRGSPPEALNLLMASLVDSTIKQYNVTLKFWWQFCQINNTNVFRPPKASVLSFLSQQYTNGCSYSSLNRHRSALSLFLGDNIGSDETVKRLLKGAFRLKPSIPKYSSIWDPQLVLNHVSQWYPNTEISLVKITKKLVGLLALCTAHRVQTLCLIKLENITISNDGTRICITELIKTSAPGRDQPVLLLPHFTQNISISPATVLKDYIFVTKNKRTASTGQLLLTYKAPHKPVTTQSVSRWIKQVMAESGVDTTVFSAHSTRHAATSTAHLSGLSVDTIRKTAGWSSTSNTFTKFYNRMVINEEMFANSVCLT